MDERTELLICLGAAAAANCVPCFEHYFEKAETIGLTSKEVQEAVDLASKVKNGAHIVLRNSIKNVMNQGKRLNQACRDNPRSSCCG